MFFFFFANYVLDAIDMFLLLNFYIDWVKKNGFFHVWIEWQEFGHMFFWGEMTEKNPNVTSRVLFQ